MLEYSTVVFKSPVYLSGETEDDARCKFSAPVYSITKSTDGVVQVKFNSYELVHVPWSEVRMAHPKEQEQAQVPMKGRK